MNSPQSLLPVLLVTLAAGCAANPPPTCPEPLPRPEPSRGVPGGEWTKLPVRIQFDEGEAALTAEAEQLLSELVESLAGRDDVRVLAIDGHANEREQDAEALSRSRALAVLDRLREGLGARYPIALRWFGNSLPIPIDNTADDPRPASRRVELLTLVIRN